MHISLAGLFIKTVKLLCVGNGAESTDSHYLCLTSCEDTGTVNSGQYAYLSSKRSDLVDASAVNTLALIEPVSYDLLLQLIENFFKHSALLGILLVVLLMNCIIYRLHSCISYILVIGIESLLNVLAYHSLDLIEEVVVNFHRLELKLRLTDLLLDTLDEFYHLLDLCVTCFDSLEHQVIGDLVSACLDHYDLFSRACNCQVQFILSSLLESGVEHQLTVNIADIDGSHRAVPGNMGDGYSDGSCDHTCDLG